MTAHVREATTPLGGDPDLVNEGNPDAILLADCSCGETYTVQQGRGEGERLDAAHALHVAQAEAKEGAR